MNWVHPTAVVECELADRGIEIGAHAYVAACVELGDRVKVGPGTVIGATGFGYVRDGDGRWHRKPHRRGVIVGNDVEIGANACIDRGSYRHTVIGRGAKIDNLVHVAHNALIGEDCVIVAGGCVCGSAILGDGVYLAPGAVVRDHCFVGAGSLVALGAVVTADVGAGRTVAGVPARDIGASRLDEVASPVEAVTA